MISVFSGEFLFHPAAIEISGNTCSHNCFYCFANIRKSYRRMELMPTINKLKRIKPSVYLDYLIKEQYPICLSNRSDPFSKNNYLDTIALAPYLATMENGLFIQTKGGYGIDEFINIMRSNKKYNIVFYITITSNNNDISKRIEPNAPLISERIELIEKIINNGYMVVAAYNPLVEEWLDYNSMIELTNILHKIGVNDIILEPLHLNKQERGYLPKEKLSYLTDTMITNLDKKRNDVEYRQNNYTSKVLKYLRENNINTFKLGQPYPTNIFNNIKSKLNKIFPNLWDVINYCYNIDYSKGYILTIDKYLEILNKEANDFFNKPFKGLGNNYIIRASFQDWKGNLSIQRINTINGIFKMYWNYKRVRASLQNNYLFRLIVNANNEPILDNNNNLMLYFDGDIHYYDRVICSSLINGG